MELGEGNGPPGLGISGDQRRTSVLEPEWAPPSLGWTPKATDGPAAPAEEVVTGRNHVSGSVPHEASEAAGHPLIDLGAPT